MATVLVKLTVEGVEIEGAVELPEGPAPRRLLLPTLQKLCDTVVAVAEQREAAEGRTISCTKGCDACCRQMVPISATEAHGLAALLDAMVPARAARILERFDEAVDLLDRRGVLERLLNRAKLTPEELQQVDRDYFAANVPCPFLEKKACSIHKDRPLACREFLVTSPAKFCADPGSGRVEQVIPAAKLSLGLARVEKEPWLPLVLARTFVAAHREEPAKKPAAELQKILRAL